MRTFLLSLGAALVACAPPAAPVQTAPPAPSRPVAQFPREELVEALAEARAPSLQGLPAAASGFAPRWEVQEQPSDALAVHAPTTPFERVVAASLEERSDLRMTEGATCAAREVARWAAETGGLPSHGQLGFLTSACGETTAGPAHWVLFGSGPASVTEAQQARAAARSLFAPLGTSLRQNARYGVGYARAGERTTVAVVSAVPQAELEAVSLSEDGTRARIRGRALVEQGLQVVGIANQGRYGVTLCQSSGAAEAPAFDVRCPFPAEDTSMWVALHGFAPGRVVGLPVARVFVRRDASSAPTYEALVPWEGQGAAPDADEAEAEDGGRAFVAHLNTVREAAGLPPVGLAEAQSGYNASLAPAFLRAVVTADREVLNQVGLAALAGYRVAGATPIRTGHLAGGALQTGDPRVVLSDLLATPNGRLVLLSAGVEQVAVGFAQAEDPPILGTLLTSYEFFRQEDAAAVATAFVRRVNEARQARNRPRLRRVRLEGLHAAAERVRSGAEPIPMRALQQGIGDETERLRSPLQGYLYETLSPERMEIPPALLERGREIGVAVTFHRAQGGAWGQWVVFVGLRF